jgi:2-polyprenyl-3-methyl-5-hydroxy-6-metoxy-1,4-benzoquinol methylase
MLHAKNKIVKSIIKKSLKEIKQVKDDTTDLEINWVKIYKNSKNSKLDAQLKSLMKKLPECDFALEHGCSIGKTSEILAKHAGTIFGIDKSFFALVEAKKRKIRNSDFFVADSLSMPFGDKKFDVVIALNVLELIEPLDLLKTIDNQVSQFVILSDPYDYERGKNSVKNRLDEKILRKKLTQMGLRLILGTSRPNFIPWSLNVNSRLELNYKVDLIFAKRLHGSINR